MSNLTARLRGLTGKLLRTGFFSVFFSQVLCKVLSFVGGMVIVRILSKSDYGAYTYVLNCYGMLMLLGDLGCYVAVMQFCNENHADPQKFDAYFTYGLKRAMLFSLFTSFLLLVSPLFYPFKTVEAAGLTRMLCLMPVLGTASNFLLANLLIRLENTRFAAVNLFQTFIHYLVILPLSYWFGITGAIFSNYVIQILVLLFSLAASRKLLHFSWRNDVLDLREKWNFLKLAVSSQLNNGTSQALMLLDVCLIGVIIGSDEVISSYKVSTTIPTALSFIPIAIMTYANPYFARNIQNRSWVRRSYFKLTLGCAAGNLIITLGSILSAFWVIPLIFGRQYEDAVSCFIVLMIGYFFSASFQVPSQNIIYTQRKVRVNIIITFLSGVSNCVLDAVLIFYYGSIGAALATTLVHIINSALCVGYLCFYLREAKT